MTEVTAKYSDYLWAALAVVATLVAFLQVPALVNALAALGSSELSIWGRLSPLLFVSIGLVAAGWIVMGAWRRTVWGCRVPSSVVGSCPRHGPRCVSSSRSVPIH